MLKNVKDQIVQLTKRLKQLYFRLYEVELELNTWEDTQESNGIDELEYIETLKTRKTELYKQIEDILYEEIKDQD